jgi:hypothetical protein
MSSTACIDCAQPYQVLAYRGMTKRCPSCKHQRWREGALKRGRCPDALLLEAKAGFIGPKWPRSKPFKPSRVAPEGYKYCGSCETVKVRDDFYPNAHTGSHYNHCKACRQISNNRNRLGRDFSLTPGEYEEMSVAQNHLCKICKLPERIVVHGKLRKLAVDHCHKTGVIRGLLCSTCNRGLGCLQDSIENLRSAIEYLQHHADRPVL